MLSSLAFAEDKDTVENNFWQAHEIASCNLNANLVVLSSCETGYGAFQQGNGIASIARAFMYADVSALVVSLWPVNDQSTAPLMQYFYHNLAKGIHKDQALQNAKLSYIEQAEEHRAHPAYWAPFIQQGDNCPIQLRKKIPLSTWGLLALFLLLVLAVVPIYTKRKRG